MALGDVVSACVCNPEIKSEPPYWEKDEDGYLVCTSCGGILNYMKVLAECDTCDNKFKGYKKYPKIAYTCSECE